MKVLLYAADDEDYGSEWVDLPEPGGVEGIKALLNAEAVDQIQLDNLHHLFVNARAFRDGDPEDIPLIALEGHVFAGAVVMTGMSQGGVFFEPEWIARGRDPKKDFTGFAEEPVEGDGIPDHMRAWKAEA